MTKKEARKVFFSFLKKQGMYTKYMRAFKDETAKAVEDRYNKRSENSIVEFLNNNTYNYWILCAFTWTFNGNWNYLHHLWLEYYNNYETEHSAIPAANAD